jgi:hypothetical protein
LTDAATRNLRASLLSQSSLARTHQRIATVVEKTLQAIAVLVTGMTVKDLILARHSPAHRGLSARHLD